MALASTQPLTETRTRGLPCGVKMAGAYSWKAYHFRVQIVWKSWEPQPPGALGVSPGLHEVRFHLNSSSKSYSCSTPGQ
jgi:hypothetical protein